MNARYQRARQMMMDQPDCAKQFSPEKFSVRSQSNPHIYYTAEYNFVNNRQI